MKQILSKTCYVLGVGAIIAALIAGFLAYMIVGFDPATQEYTDGLGRPLGPSPFFMRFVFDEDKLWAGWGWWAIDMLVFLGVIAVAMKFFGLGKKVKGKGPVQEAPEDLDATGVANEILLQGGILTVLTDLVQTDYRLGFVCGYFHFTPNSRHKWLCRGMSA